jgi:hypothetical protein
LRDQIIFDDRADDAGCSFRPEGDRIPATVGEGERFLADDIGGFADPAME